MAEKCQAKAMVRLVVVDGCIRLAIKAVLLAERFAFGQQLKQLPGITQWKQYPSPTKVGCCDDNHNGKQ